MSDFHFGYLKNNERCPLGCHWGLGNYRPEERAARAARMRDTMPELMPEIMREFLIDWEKHHGRVHYRMEVVGINTGTFVKANKGQDIIGPVFVDPYAVPANDLFNKRADIYG